MKNLIKVIAALAVSTQASAACVNGSILTTCNDALSGNSYSTQDYGNLSITNGFNSRTGSNWSQQTRRIGNMSITNGMDAEGRSWNTTTQNLGHTTITNGYDSSGNSFSCTTIAGVTNCN